ncbi:FG-GAP repeat domain-containing protein [Arthrobacter sp. YN]|uniref:FG-GAP repeat domain-containing protein n=1 Tax=Arthrobacter sp. YN TaxID=2020486 RepID=UPI000B6025A9|nr:VCBS repeat-containing protein [Arthrobacter sp. YN]ASN19503.1 hypothetical protein CGK93_07240 [Arthrobacter sp. YN]
MGNFRGFAMKLAALAALLVASSITWVAPATAAVPQVASDEWAPRMNGTAYVGSELAISQVQHFNPCPTEEAPNGFVLEWLSNGVPLPAERQQGHSLKLIPEDRGNRISFNARGTCPEAKAYRSAETPPVAASNRATGWTGRGNFELLGRTHNGDLVLYPRTYEPVWSVFCGQGIQCMSYKGSWDEPRLVGSGWNIFDIVFSPGDFDGDGFNDVLGRDGAGNLRHYPGDGEGGWLAPRPVGSGWQIFDSIVGAGDFSGDGNNDVLARDRAGKLFLYPGDGHGGWLPPSQVGSGWQIFNKIVAPGNTNGDGGVDIFARDNRGVLHQYPTDGHGGWKAPTVVGPGWEGMTEINGAGRFSRINSPSQESNDVTAVDQEGNLVLYPGWGQSGLYNAGQIGSGWNTFKNLI